MCFERTFLSKAGAVSTRNEITHRNFNKLLFTLVTVAYAYFSLGIWQNKK